MEELNATLIIQSCNTGNAMIGELVREINQVRFKSYIVGFTRGIRSSFTSVVKSRYFILHLLAIAISIPLVLFVDWNYFVFFRTYWGLEIFLFPAVMIGGLVPLVVPPIIYLYGKHTGQDFDKFSFCLTQVAVVGLFWSSVYKAFSGRMGPELDKYTPGMSDYSNKFYFGILLGGVFDGWPSGHTTIAVAFAVVYFLYPREQNDHQNRLERLINNRWLGVYFALYVAFGVSTNIHWLSDVVAGIPIGISVGVATFRSFRSSWDETNDDQVASGEWDRTVKYTFAIIFATIFFSIFIPRKIFGF